MKILYAPEVTILNNKQTLFLAGPIRCTRNWQQQLIDLFNQDTNKYPNLVIANPHRREGVVPLKDFQYEMFDEQIKWEMKHLADAADHGVISYFLANQLERDPFQSYARTTRFELGEWFGELKNRNDIKIVIGWEKQFPGLKYIVQRIKFLCAINKNKKNQIKFCEEEGLDCFKTNIINMLNT